MNGTLGEIKLFAGVYAPENWSYCRGQILAINNDTAALYSLLGNTYGGDGRNTFGLPDLRGRVIVGSGQLEGGMDYHLSSTGGQETVSLTTIEMPNHQHSFMVSNQNGDEFSPEANTLASPVMTSGSYDVFYYLPEDPTEEKILPLDDGVLQNTGEGSPHNNMMPYFAMNYIICTKGLYPQRQ